mmetsp:Transcript_11692/g.17712  ORF Transcript_11692/g.17712 Transcript_11692/m.17712 type:complete len:136 (-) Transcript_11692:346-753(-)
MNAYPFANPDPSDLSRYSVSVFKASKAQDLIKDSLSCFLEWPFEVLCFCLKYIEEFYGAKYNEMIFTDCMGIGMQAAVIASTFSFKEVITIELSEEDTKRTQKIIKECAVDLPSIVVRVGRVQVNAMWQLHRTNL